MDTNKNIPFLSGGRTEKEKMLAGEMYFASDPVLVAERLHARRLLRIYNSSMEDDQDRRHQVLGELFGTCGSSIEVEPVFCCDYGYNIHVGERFYANFNCVILDICEVRIGADCLLAPGVHIYTACHPLDPVERKEKLECGKPVTIGDNVWIGGQAIILPGISIGDNAVIAAGAVVSRDVPANSLVMGNPAKVQRFFSADAP